MRLHNTLRRANFTPTKVARGPGKEVALSTIRTTIGITESGQRFMKVDDWTDAECAHKRGNERWFGWTIFEEKVGEPCGWRE